MLREGPKQKAEEMVKRLELAGARRASVLVELLRDGAGSLLESIFPDDVAHDQEVIELLESVKGMVEKRLPCGSWSEFAWKLR